LIENPGADLVFHDFVRIFSGVAGIHLFYLFIFETTFLYDSLPVVPVRGSPAVGEHKRTRYAP
jgi:hypothetical protein